MAAEPADDFGLVVQEIVYAGLEALRSAARLDLCAYLHAIGDAGPQLFLGSPDLSALEPAEAFTLFSSLRDALEAEHDGDEISLPGSYAAIAVTTRGARSRGLHVIGRRDPLVEAERNAAIRLCRAVGSACHAVEAGAGGVEARGASEPVRVAVEVVDGEARAEVSVARAGEIRTGMGQAAAAPRAVALAVIDTVDPSLKLADASEVEVEGERAVLVLLSDDLGRSALGAALCGPGQDPLRAAAEAALDAASRVARPG